MIANIAWRIYFLYWHHIFPFTSVWLRQTFWNRNHPGIGNCLSWLMEVTYRVSREIMCYIECTSQFHSNAIKLINLHMFGLNKNVLYFFWNWLHSFISVFIPVSWCCNKIVTSHIWCTYKCTKCNTPDTISLVTFYPNCNH